LLPEENVMMSLQARESFHPYIGTGHPLRAYAVDSPRAKARLVVLAMLADGRLDERELEVLERRGVFAALGIAREDFVQVLYDFCHDVAGLLPVGRGGFRLTPATLSGLLGEVDNPGEREKLLQLITAVISSDGRLSDAEESLFMTALEAWKPPLANLPRAVFPEWHYG
jgi:hypothetical protein